MTLALLPETPARAGDEDVQGELLLRFKPGAGERAKKKVLTSLGLKAKDEIRQIGVITVSVPKGALHRVKSALSRDPSVDFVEVNEEVPPLAFPNDQYYELQWHLQKISAEGAWDISLGDPSIVVAVLDTGVDPNHPELAEKLLEGYNAYDDSGDAMDDVGHGTMVAGVVGAVTNNGLGIAAIGWRISILPVKVNYPGVGGTTYSLLAKGLVYAADRGAKVANLSWQIFNGSALASAAKYFVEKGGLVVAGAGNTGKYEGYEDSPYIVSVGATDRGDALASFSSYGPYIDLSAPGVGIFTTITGKQATSYDYAYGYASGTSLSAPLTAGLAALIFSANPSLSPAQVERVLESTAVDLGEPGYDIYFGWGRIDAYEALRMAVGAEPYDDHSPPTVAIIQPSDGAMVSGEVVVGVDASDDVSISKVELYKDGVLYATDLEAPFEFYWDTTDDPDGLHTLSAKAYDSSNNVAESKPVRVYVANHWTPIFVDIAYPLDGSKVSGTITISASASGGLGITKVEFYIDDRLKSTDCSQPYEYRWRTKSVKDGWHTIGVRAYDSIGNYAEASVRVLVSNRR
jgi:hypothetical protein